MKREGEKGATASAITRDLRADRLRVGIPMLAVATIFLFTLLLQTCLDTLVFALAPTWREAAWYPWVLSMAPM